MRINHISEMLVGDWIIIKERSGIQYKGYITRIKQSTFDFYCTIIYDDGKETPVRNPHFKDMNTYSNSYFCFKDGEMPLDEIEDKRHLIDLALSTKDDEWFRELVN